MPKSGEISLRAREVPRFVVLLVRPAVRVALGVAAERLRREVAGLEPSMIVSAASMPDLMACGCPRAS